jgi:hypothetical protein
MAMNWPWSNARRGDVVAVLILLFFGVVLIVAAATSSSGPNYKFNFGLGPDWQCESLGYGDPVCLKKVPARPGQTR